MSNARRESRSAVLPWTVCLLGASYFGYGYFLRIAPSVMIDELMRDFAVTAAVVGNVAAVFYYVYAAMQVPIGLAVDNTGPRRILVAAALVAALGTALFAAAEDLTLLFASRVLIGAGCAAAWVSTLKLATEWLPPSRYALLAGLTNLIGMVGAVAGQAPMARFVAAVGWREASYWSAAFGLALAAAFWLSRYVADPPFPRRRVAAESGVGFALRTVLGRRRPWLLAAFCAFAAGPMIGFAVLWAVPYVGVAYGADTATAGFLASAALIGWGAGAPVSGWLSEWLGLRKPVLLAAPVVGLAVWAVLLTVPELPLGLVYLLLLVNGLATSGVIVGFAVAREITPTNASGTMSSLINMSMMLFIAGFQIVVGLLLDLNWQGGMADGVRVYAAETYIRGFLIVPVSLTIALILGSALPETRCRPLDEGAAGSG